MILQLQVYKNQYPLAFTDNRDYINQLIEPKQLTLVKILEQLEEDVSFGVSLVINVFDLAEKNLESLAFIVESFSKFNCLNDDSISSLWLSKDLNKLVDDFKILEALDEYQKDSCSYFLKTYKHQHKSIERLIDFLSHDINLNSLTDAVELFNFSSFEANENNLYIVKILSNILANPLSQTIYYARLRCFSDYSQSSEPLNDSLVADEIINQLIQPYSFEIKIHKFVDYFIDFRPFPESQKYIVDLNVAELVTFAIEHYCEQLIETISNKNDYRSIKQLIEHLQNNGATQKIINAIKFDVASTIESEDYCSSRNYAQLMNEISEQARQPQIDLDVSQSLKIFDDKYKISLASLLDGLSIYHSVDTSGSASPEPKAVLSPDDVNLAL